MEKILKFFEKTLGINTETQIKIIISLIFILFFVTLYIILVKILWRKIENIKTRYITKKTLLYVTVIFIIFTLVQIWFRGFRNAGTFLGLFSAALAIALKDLITNIAGWFFIIIRRPFTVGDRIQVGENMGDVIDIRLFQFTLVECGNWVDADQSTGRIIHVPNGKIFTEPLSNYTKGFEYIWNEIPVLITFESNWKKAKKILESIADKHSGQLSSHVQQKVKRAARKFMIFYTKLTPAVYTSIKDSGVLLTTRYLCEPRDRRGSAQTIWENILEEFALHKDIDFAYPTQRFYDNLAEGKLSKTIKKEKS